MSYNIRDREIEVMRRKAIEEIFRSIENIVSIEHWEGIANIPDIMHLIHRAKGYIQVGIDNRIIMSQMAELNILTYNNLSEAVRALTEIYDNYRADYERSVAQGAISGMTPPMIFQIANVFAIIRGPNATIISRIIETHPGQKIKEIILKNEKICYFFRARKGIPIAIIERAINKCFGNVRSIQHFDIGDEVEYFVSQSSLGLIVSDQIAAINVQLSGYLMIDHPELFCAAPQCDPSTSKLVSPLKFPEILFESSGITYCEREIWGPILSHQLTLIMNGPETHITQPIVPHTPRTSIDTPDWIMAHSPMELTAQEYYKQYVTEAERLKLTYLTIQKFSKVVKRSGYVSYRKGNIRHWKKR